MLESKLRALKLVMQISADGFAAEHDGGTDWMLWDWGHGWSWDCGLRQYHVDLATTSDCILLSRKTAEEGFHAHWKDLASTPNDPQWAFAKPIVEMKKVVLTRTLERSKWENTELARGDILEFVAALKRQPGRDVLVYVGPTLASSLLGAGLIDHLHIFYNPVFLGAGKPMFAGLNSRLPLRLIATRDFESGIVVNQYAPLVNRVPASNNNYKFAA